ncbi:MAG: hypothetical protein Q4B65_01980, partial [Candidatus Saccharibacteria bacterium]|nr:hypothetical protein [Candidatus Saccharibacteria bacterium]
MAKEVAVLKRAKISQAQQYMLFAVLGASIVLGVAIALTLHFVNRIGFNIDVIAKEEAIIKTYSDAIAEFGVCTEPKGEIYTDDELKKCKPNEIEASAVQNTLRSNVLEKMATNEALDSVPNQNTQGCVDPVTK